MTDNNSFKLNLQTNNKKTNKQLFVMNDVKKITRPLTVQHEFQEKHHHLQSPQ